MGCDGGTIPKRDELVRKKKKEEQKDKNADILAKWRYCALSCNELRSPIVACELGYLYNKEAVIEYLLNRDTNGVAEKFSHLRGLRDVIELNLTEKSNYETKPTDNGNDYVDIQDSKYICPISTLEMNGKYRFLFFRQCGCVISERALKELKTNSTCLKCNKTIDTDDFIIINATDEEIIKYKEKMDIRRAEAKLKKSKKRKLETESEVKSTIEQPSTSSSSNSTSSAIASTSKVLKSKEKQSSRSVVKSATACILPPTAREDYSVAKDPEKSEAFKSLFTSHKSAEKPKAHWVTYNPLYF